jgi:hypothetical protein
MEVNMKILRLGVIGLSPGNGHPYSWSAIFNGYDPVEMELCGFPSIPRYLEQHVFPRDSIASAKVTHIWAQDSKRAAHVAKATYIEHVVDDYTDMVGEVDGLLLARDDAENHLKFASAFISSGIPVYIDKPLALSISDAEELLDLQQYPGQIFTCSALRYAREFQLSAQDHQSIGTIRHIHAMVPNDWDKYAVHVVEPVLLMIRNRGLSEVVQLMVRDDATTLTISYGGEVQVQISAMGFSKSPISIRVMGDLGWKDMYFGDSFFAFKTALNKFVESASNRTVPIESDFMLEVVSIIQAGRTR